MVGGIGNKLSDAAVKAFITKAERGKKLAGGGGLHLFITPTPAGRVIPGASSTASMAKKKFIPLTLSSSFPRCCPSRIKGVPDGTLGGLRRGKRA